MSADRWAICPACARKADHTKAKAIQKAGELYGKVPPAEYQKAIEVASKDAILNETMREYKEWFIEDDGALFMSFSASCGTCGTKYHYTATIKTPFCSALADAEEKP